MRTHVGSVFARHGAISQSMLLWPEITPQSLKRKPHLSFPTFQAPKRNGYMDNTEHSIDSETPEELYQIGDYYLIPLRPLISIYQWRRPILERKHMLLPFKRYRNSLVREKQIKNPRTQRAPISIFRTTQAESLFGDPIFFSNRLVKSGRIGNPVLLAQDPVRPSTVST